MRLLAFDPLRCTDLPGISYLKPEHLQRELGRIRQADWLLFPPTYLVNSLVYALHRRIFPALPGYHLGFDKVEMTRAFQVLCPANVPYTLILPATPSGIEQALDEMVFPMVVKEPRNSMGRGVHLVQNAAELRGLADRLEALYVQEHLPIDRDLRVVWVGDRVLAAYWRIGAEGSFHNNVAQGGAVSWEDIPQHALDLVGSVAAELGLDYAGFDLAFVDGHPFFLEFNLLFGNEALNAKGIKTGPAILDYLERRSEAERR